MQNTIKLKIAESDLDLSRVFDIRKRVFVLEQKVDEREEYDDFEETSTHLLAFLNEEPVGTARIRRTINGIKLERFAVLEKARGYGIGEALLKKSLDLAEDEPNIYLHAQIQVVDFYRKYGFISEGDEFIEAGIRHYKMVFKT